MLKVVKFGGTSMADANQYKKVKAIIDADPSRKVVIVSAAGKRFSDDHKVTDLLYLCHAHVKYGVDCSNIFDMIAERYISIKSDLGLTIDIESHLAKIKNDLQNGISKDELVSRGEYLSALLMADYLGYRFVDAADWINFEFNGEVNTSVSYSKLCEVPIGKGIVIPGFYGVMPNGDIRVMSRGGSDITGALAAAALEADVYENWTDVPGVLMADPRIVNDPKPIKNITYEELRELSYMGAQVLHEDTVLPVKERDIPLNIRDTNNPELPGTMILKSFQEDEESKNCFITGITGRKDFIVVNFIKSGFSTDIGVIRKVCEVFEKHEIPLEYVPSGIDSISVVVSSKAAKKHIYGIINEIQKTLKPESVDISESIAVIAVIGRKMSSRPGTSGRIFGALGENGINIRMISQGSDERNIIFGIDNKDYEKTISVLYDKFVR